MELKLSKVYVPIDGLGDSDTPILLITENYHNEPKVRYVEFHEDKYLLSKEELEGIIVDAWVKGWDNCDGASKINLEQYLKSKLK